MGEGEGFEVVFVGLAKGENVSRCVEEEVEVELGRT